MRSPALALIALTAVILGCGGETKKPASKAAADYRGRPATSRPFMPSDAKPEAKPAEKPADLAGQQEGEFNTEAYDRVYDNPFVPVAQEPLSTFSIDVDTASYSNVRRFLSQGQLPPKDAVRIEELLNYFTYDYAPPEGDAPFAAHVEVASCPWNAKHRLARIGIKGREVPQAERGPANLVFLLDVSGSMDQPNKLPLVKAAMKMLVEQLADGDRVAIAVYAGASGLVLPSTPCASRQVVLDALERLKAGGSTNGGQGIQLAYAVAREGLVEKGINRVVLCTDGDFNVGVTNQGDLVRMVEEQAASGVFLTVLGFGMGNIKDSTLEKLADKGNGNYGYIDTIYEARKLLVEQVNGTLVTIAKDVKIQVDFNPARVGAYRLIGYENRMLRPEDFLDDAKDAGEIGSGHTVTALYELVPPGEEAGVAKVEPSKYQEPAKPSAAAATNELFTLRMRYKLPDQDQGRPLEKAVPDSPASFNAASPDFQFAAAVACFGMVLRDSPHKGQSSFDMALELAGTGRGRDPGAYRAQFVELVKAAKACWHGRGAGL